METALIETVEDLAEIRGGHPIVALSRTEAGIAVLRADLAGKVYDLTTTKGNEEARGDRLRCVTLRTTLEKKRKELKAPAIEFGKKIDDEARRLTAAIEAIEQPIDNAIKADEARRESERIAKEKAERERKDKLAQGVRTILNYITLAQAPGMTAERIAKGLAALNGMRFGDDWQEYRQQAEDARLEAVTALTQIHAGAIEREAEAARLADGLADLERQRAAMLAARPAEPDTPPQEPQQVLKAEPAQPADATDRGTPASASPGGGPMGAGQPAAAGPDEAVMKVGEINARIAPLKIDGAGINELGIKTGRAGAAVTILTADWPALCRAMVNRIGKAA